MDTLSPAYQFLFSIAAAILLTQIPYIGKYFKVINTMMHESAHAFVALLLNAEVIQIELLSDTSGSAVTKTGSKWKRFFISFAGYPLATAIAWLLFYIALKEWYLPGLIGLLIVILLNLTFFVRNMYGIFWLVTYGLIIAIVLYFKNPLLTSLVLYITAGIILIESIISIIQLLIIAWKQPNKAGDAKNLKDITYLPSLFWVFVFLIITLIIVWDVISRFFGF